jgi:hypothetical protein
MASIKISDIDSDVLANLVRDGAYTSGETIGLDSSNRFLLVLAVPYGEVDQVSTKKEALEAFHELLDCTDWFERNIKCLTIDESGRPVIEELRHEDCDDEDCECEDPAHIHPERF